MISTIFSITCYVLVGIVVLLGISWLNSKNKKNSSKSSTEKLAGTLQRKFDKWINDLNRKLRSPEDIQEEMLDALDDYKASKIKEIKNAIANITETQININDNLKKLRNAKYNIVDQLRKMKKSGDIDDNTGANMMMQIESLNKSIETSEKSVGNLDNQILAINTAVAKFGNKIELKRAEVLTLIANYMASNYNATIKFDIDLSDLMSDYTTEIKTIERQNKIDELVSSKVIDEPAENDVPEKYVEMFHNFK